MGAGGDWMNASQWVMWRRQHSCREEAEKLEGEVDGGVEREGGREGGSGKMKQREVHMVRLSFQLVSLCPSTAGQGCVWLLYLDGCWASGEWRGPSFQWRGAFHGALRKQALDERCEDGPVITALCGTCLCWIWLTSPSYSPLTSGATLLSFSLPPPLTSASPLLSDKEARERGEVKHKEQRDVRWKCQHIYLCSGNGSSHGLSWQRPLQKVSLKMGHEWAKFPVIK